MYPRVSNMQVHYLDTWTLSTSVHQGALVHLHAFFGLLEGIYDYIRGIHRMGGSLSFYHLPEQPRLHRVGMWE